MADSDALIGQIVSHYRIIEKLGSLHRILQNGPTEPGRLVEKDSIGISRTHSQHQTANEERSKNLTIMCDCGDNYILVQQFKSLRFKEFKGAVIDKDPPSDPMDKDRHLIDCVSYILLDDPWFINRRRPKHVRADLPEPSLLNRSRVDVPHCVHRAVGAGASSPTLRGKVIAICLNGGETGSVCHSTALVR
jgi:hypothetical protein